MGLYRVSWYILVFNHVHDSFKMYRAAEYKYSVVFNTQMQWMYYTICNLY